MIPVHLPYKEQWFILVISILDCCILFLIPLTSVKTLNIKLSYTHLKANSSAKECRLLYSEEGELFQANKISSSVQSKQTKLTVMFLLYPL